MALLFVSELILLDAKGNWKLFFKEQSKPYSAHLLSPQLPFSGKCPSTPVHTLLQCHPDQQLTGGRYPNPSWTNQRPSPGLASGYTTWARGLHLT